MPSVVADVRRRDLEGIALLHVVIVFVDRLDEQLIAAGAECGEAELAVKSVEIGSLALGGCLHAGEIVSVQVADIGIQPGYCAAGADSAAYTEILAAEGAARNDGAGYRYRARWRAYRAVLRRSVAQNGVVARSFAALDHVVYTVALDGVYRRVACTLDNCYMLGKAVALTVIFKRVDKQQVACLRSVLLRAPQAVLLEPFHAAEAAGKVRYNALGYARIACTPAYEHCAPRLAGQTVPRAVLCAVLEFFTVAELRLGNAHEAFAPAAPGVGKRRRGKSEQHHRRKDKAHHSLSHIFSPSF